MVIPMKDPLLQFGDGEPRRHHPSNYKIHWSLRLHKNRIPPFSSQPFFSVSFVPSRLYLDVAVHVILSWTYPHNGPDECDILDTRLMLHDMLIPLYTTYPPSRIQFDSRLTA